jgi:hypothetical protein
MSTKTIRIKNENCKRAGFKCYCEGRRHCGDCTLYPCTRKEARRLRLSYERGDRDWFMNLHIAHTIEHELGLVWDEAHKRYKR